MRSPPPNLPTWPRPSPEHTTKELENRLVHLELRSEEHHEKLSLHERAILGILGALYIIAQDKLPALADLIRGVLQ